jgi:hypothetical protein
VESGCYFGTLSFSVQTFRQRPHYNIPFNMTASSHLALISGFQAILGPVVLQLSGLRSSLSVITGLATATGG